ncbi:MAG: ATPase [Epulopiscium sp.]|nr:ATPase [Candidatus Epulonipiscium sp.]
MNQKGKIKHVFPGGNTTRGFVSFYDNILFQEEANRIIVIKGGPGVGKSFFMKKISDSFLNLGYHLEHHHCSSDSNSLDGIVIPDIKIAFLDGTAPHMVDPLTPGAVDEILNLGDFWDEEGIRKNKDNILKANKEVSRLFKKAYSYLEAAFVIYESWRDTESLAFNNAKANLKVEELIKSLFENYPVTEDIGRDRHLFGTAITPNGLIEYLHTIIGGSKNVYVIKDSPGASSKNMMEKIYKEAVMRGLDVECYHSPIDVDKVEDIIIPSLDSAVTVVNSYHRAKIIPTNITDFTSYLNEEKLRYIQAEIDKDKKLFEDLVQKSVVFIQKAKEAHDKVENYYISNMDFNKVDGIIKATIERILPTEM